MAMRLRAFSSLVAGRCATVVAASIEREAVRLSWSDGHVSRFHHEWLRDHCPQSVHPVSGQREVPLERLRSESLTLDDASLGEAPSGDQTLRLRWLAHASAAHDSTFETSWLRTHCYTGVGGGGVGGGGGGSASSAAVAATAWWPDDVAAAGLPSVEWRDLVGPPDDRSASSASDATERATLRCLRLLRRWGFCLVRRTPSSVDGTAALASRLGIVQPTFYGDGVWDTAPRADPSAVVDTAYSNAALPLHTDCTYLQQTPGLQLFNCVAQAGVGGDSGSLEGSTRLADSLAAAAVMRERHRSAFDFFRRALIPFEHHDGEVHHCAIAPVFRSDPRTGEVVGIRYNETDRAPLDSLGFDDVGAFYEHVHALHDSVESVEVAVRLEVGDAIVIDNHRVMHGRHAFSGHRNMLGCYLTADDWRSRLRVLEARHGAE